MPENAILTMNAGSSSLKFALFAAGPGHRRLLDGAVERIGGPAARLSLRRDRTVDVSDLETDAAPYETAFEAIFGAIGKAAGDWRIEAVGHRVAHGGPDCDCPKPITEHLRAALGRLVPLAPLHLPANLAGIDAVTVQRPGLPQVACFDTAFHHDLPRLARMTGFPPDVGGPELRRYGYHGLSYEYILRALRDEEVGLDRERMIVAHLGNGASMVAIRNGRPVETTMGFSTLSGLPMGSRSGDVDPGLILHLQRQQGLTAEAVETLLFTRSGLLGLSGISNDMRELLSRPEDRAAEAVDYFCYHARRHLAGLTAALGGLDRLVFTGGIGANAAKVRRRICDGLSYLGIRLDPEANARGDLRLSPSNARVAVEARQTDEEAMIARHVREVLDGDGRPMQEAS